MQHRDSRPTASPRKPVNGQALENPTIADAELDALVSQVDLDACDAWSARGRQRSALHAFMGSAYGLAFRLKNDEAEFGRVMKARGIKKPKLDHLYYQVIQAFQPVENRADPELKSDASRLKRAFVKAEELGYTSADFVRRIEHKELVAGRMISGVNKLIKMAQHSRSSRKPEAIAEIGLRTSVAPAESCESSHDLSNYFATMLNTALPIQERMTAMEEAAKTAEQAGISPDDIRVVMPTGPSESSRFLSPSLKNRKPRRSHRQSSGVGEGSQQLRHPKPSGKASGF